MDSRRVSSYSQPQQPAHAESNPFAQEAQGLAQLIQVDMQLDDLSQDLIQRIKFYQSRLQETNETIHKLEKDMNRPSANEYTQSRLNANLKSKKLLQKQILTLERHLLELVQGSAQFREQKQEIVDKYQQEKEKRDQELMDINEATDMEDLKEDLRDIDEQLKEIEEVNNRNYKIDESYLELYSEYFNMLDQEIADEPPHHYNENNLPSYYPDNGIWFNQADVNIKNQPALTDKESRELEQLDSTSQPSHPSKKGKQQSLSKDQGNKACNTY